MSEPSTAENEVIAACKAGIALIDAQLAEAAKTGQDVGLIALLHIQRSDYVGRMEHVALMARMSRR